MRTAEPPGKPMTYNFQDCALAGIATADSRALQRIPPALQLNVLMQQMLINSPDWDRKLPLRRGRAAAVWRGCQNRFEVPTVGFSAVPECSHVLWNCQRAE